VVSTLSAAGAPRSDEFIAGADVSHLVFFEDRGIVYRDNGQPQDAPAFLSITAEGINKDDILTSQIDNIWLPFAGAFSGTPVAGLKQTVLLKSTADSQLVDGFMANLSGENVMKEFKRSGTEYPLAIRLTGKFKTAFPNGKPEDKKDDKKDEEKKDADKKAEEKKPDDSLKETKQDNSVILVGDADMIFDHFALRQIQTPFGNISQPLNGNLNLAQNAVEQLAGDSNLIGVRSRATRNRPFEKVKQMEAAANEKFQSEIKRLEESKADAQPPIAAHSVTIAKIRMFDFLPNRTLMRLPVVHPICR
jgi:ABC-type uncharacterized transport system involved in gliding motility auxiliary subunit